MKIRQGIGMALDHWSKREPDSLNKENVGDPGSARLLDVEFCPRESKV